MIKELHAQLLKLRDAETQRETLQEQNEKDTAMIAGHRQKAQQATATLEKLRSLANCKDDDMLQVEAAITASEQKSELQREHKRISDGLIERNAIADLAKIGAVVGCQAGGADYRAIIAAGVSPDNIRQFTNDPAIVDGVLAKRVQYAVMSNSPASFSRLATAAPISMTVPAGKVTSR